MAGKRAYGDPCGIARALDVVGERWALLVVRELVLGPKRFTDLRTGLLGVSTDVLSQRLRQLEQAGVLRQVTLPPPGATRAYELTDRGRELEPVLHALGRWGSREPFPATDREMTVDAFAVALSTVFDPSPGSRPGRHPGARPRRRPAGRRGARRPAARAARADRSTPRSGSSPRSPLCARCCGTVDRSRRRRPTAP